MNLYCLQVSLELFLSAGKIITQERADFSCSLLETCCN